MYESQGSGRCNILIEADFLLGEMLINAAREETNDCANDPFCMCGRFVLASRADADCDKISNKFSTLNNCIDEPLFKCA